ncbi:MAG: hypothetical protein KAT06_12045 [Gammaproteobacteria bacterium]|nr:hypothetical protein [Gammaproteobacteria bacterium]
MFRKILTHVIILTLTALPVQVITAGVESSSMQMSMAKVTQAEQKCLHTSASGDQEITKMSCCDDVSYQCESCGDCPQASSAMIILPLQTSDKTYSLNTQKFFTSHLLLNGVPQNNLLRPPRTLI